MIRELKTFIAVTQEGTFAAAGHKIGLTQAAVSAQVQRLEHELGFKLFDRSGRTARLNSQGQQTLARAHDMLQMYEELRSRRRGQPSAELVTVGAIASVHRAGLSEALTRFHKQQRLCRTRVVPGLSLELLNLTDAGEMDMAAIIRPPFALHSDLRWTTLAREPFRLLVPREVQGQDVAAILRTQPFIRYNRASFGGRQVDRFLRRMNLSVREICEADELDTLVHLVAKGVGVALVPQTRAQARWPAGLRPLDLGVHTFHRDIGLVHRANRSLSAPVRLMADLLCRAYGVDGSDVEKPGDD